MTSKALPVSDLAEVLTRHNVDTATLKLLHSSGDADVYRLVVRGAQAIDTWRQLRSLVDQTGYWPVVLGDEDSALRHQGDMERNDDRSVDRIIRVGLRLEAAKWFQAQIRERASYFVVRRGEWPEDPNFARNARAEHNEFLKAPLDNEFSIAYGHGMHGLLPLVYVALLPTTVSWHAPAFLKFGGWNWSPRSAEHVCVQRRWHERYGSEVVGMFYDTIETRVLRPPVDKASALELAWEYWAYAGDSLPDRPHDTLEGLAATLLNNRAWFFWWD